MRISGFESAYSISQVCITQEKDSHDRCTFLAQIPLEDVRKHSVALAEQVYTVSDNEGIILMKGIIEEFTETDELGYARLEVTLVSRTILMDKEEKFRIFQSPKKTVEDILRHYSCNGISLQLRGKLLSRPVETVIIQRGCTDFSFMQMMMSYCGGGIWIDSDRNTVIIGQIDETIKAGEEKTESLQYALSRHTSYRLSKEGKIVEFVTTERIRIGREITFRGDKFRVVRVVIRESLGEIYYAVTAVSRIFATCTLPCGSLLLRGRVEANQDPENLGRIQVSFPATEENGEVEDICEGDSRRWIDYLTPYVGKESGGFVMLPDVGDEVIVCIEDGIPLALATRRNRTIRTECQDVDKKSIFIKKSSALVWDGESLRIQVGENVETVLDKDHLIIRNTDKTRLDIQRDEIAIEGASRAILIASEAQLIGKSGGIRVDGKGTTISGSRIDLKSSANVD